MIENEEWRDIEGYDGLYQVSNLGRVKSLKFGKTKILKPGTDRAGYLHVVLSRDGYRKNCTVHRLVAKAFLPNPDNKPQINHINGIKTDNRVENLEWATATENLKHAVATGLQKSGEDRSDAKLTNTQVEWIRNNYVLRDSEYGTRALARKFNVDPQTISDIVRGERYTNADGKISEKFDVRKLTDDEVRFIRANYIKGDPEFGGAALAERFGVTPMTISNIIRGKSYRGV